MKCLNKIFPITCLILILLFPFFIIKSGAATVSGNESSDFSTGFISVNNNSKGAVLVTDYSQINKFEKPSLIEHKITSSELDMLKSKIGVAVEGYNYNQLVDGHGTGLRPPSEQEWTEISASLHSVDKISPKASLPSSVDQSKKPWFPPIGNQGSQGSCVAWSVGYYVKTFQEAQEYGWDVSNAKWQTGSPGYPTQSYQNKIMSPAFIYNLANGGDDDGLFYYDAINLICSVGVCSWDKMPYIQSDYTTWPSEEAWTEAPLYRGDNNGIQYMDLDNEQGITNLKSWLSSDQLATISIDANKYSQLTSGDVWTLNNYVIPNTNHANTIVGYDDNLAYIENGFFRYGAFKVANSWGVGFTGEKVPDGFYWISYATMKQTVGSCMFYYDKISYKPELAATFSITHAKRSECTIEVGLGNPNAPIITKNFNQYIDGGSLPFCQNDMLLDITEFKNYVPNVYNHSFFLRVYDGGTSTTGTINRFSIEYAQSSNAPIQTANGNTVYLTATLPKFTTTWTNANLLNADQNFIDQKIASASDSNGNMYTAYTDRYSVTNKTAVFVRKSSDGGQTWPLIAVGYLSSQNLANPSMAINPYNNEIYVAMEAEVAQNDHDIWVLRYVNNLWSWSAVSSVLGQDDRFPSITSEYQFGSLNRQYISYENIFNFNDRDLMFAKTSNHGSSWSISKLHGNWPDGNVYTQTRITNAEGNIYIAYRFGADYNSVSEIRIDRSSNFGDTWTQTADVDGLPNDCKFPSIMATHGGGVVMVAFQYQYSPKDIDICYSYSNNKGTIWTKQQFLFSSVLKDEKSISLGVDGLGGIHAICKAGRYAEYKATASLQPTNWSVLKIISDGWIGDGLSINIRLVNKIYYPFATWTDARTKNIYFSDSAQVTLTGCSIPSNSINYGQSINVTANVNAQVSDGTMTLQYSADNSTWNNISSGTPHLGSYMHIWTPPNMGTFYVRASWSGNANYKGSTSTIQQLVVKASYTITTNPTGLQITVDGMNYTSPQTFNWTIRSTHVINAASMQSENTNKRYVFTSWNDSGIQSHSIIVNNARTAIRADFKTQYYVNFSQSGINSDFSGNVITVNGSSYGRTGFSDWFDTGDMLTFSYASSSVANPNAKQYVLVSYNATSPLIISNVTLVKATYVTQHYLIVNSPYGNPTDQGWFDAGSLASFGVTTPYSIDDDSRYMFTSWNGTGSGSYTGSSSTQEIIMNNAVTESAIWQMQHKISFSVNPPQYGTIVPSGTNTWQNTGTLDISANSNSGYSFLSWTTSGLITVSQPTLSNAIATINGPGTITATFQAPVPTPTPSPTLAPTTTTPTPTQKPNPTATPQIPELPTVYLVVPLIVISWAFFLLKKKLQSGAN